MTDSFNIQVNLDFKGKTSLEIADALNGQHTAGDPVVINPPVSDVDSKIQAGDIITISGKRVTDRSTNLTKEERVLVNKGKRTLKKNGLYIQGIANDVAVAAGDINAGIAVVERCGFKVKGKPSVHPRGFEIVAFGPGWIHIRVKSAGRDGSYIWKIGITDEKGVIPEKFISEFYTRECEIIITGLQPKVIYAVVEATVMPVPKKNTKTKAPNLETQDGSLQQSAGISKPSYAIGSDPYNWSDPIFQVGI